MPDIDFNKLDYTDFMKQREKEQQKIVDIALHYMGHGKKPKDTVIKYVKKNEK